MKKRQTKKEDKKTIKEMTEGIKDYDFQKEHKEFKKGMEKEDIKILFGVIDNEFDDSPSKRWIADHLVYEYAWWFVLEEYLKYKKKTFTKEKTKTKTIYEFEGNIIEVDCFGRKNIKEKNELGRKLDLMMIQKGY